MSKPNIKQLDLNDINIQGDTQIREMIDEDRIARYVEVLDRKESFKEPIVVFHDGKSYWLADGFHRYWAGIRVDAQTLEADIRKGTRRDAILFACGANADHGMDRTDQDKHNAVETLLRDDEWSKWSDREIARRCVVSPTLVGKIRKAMPDSGSGVKKRTYTHPKTSKPTDMKTNNIGTSKPVKEFDGFGEDDNKPSKGADDKKFDDLDVNGRMIPEKLRREVFSAIGCFPAWRAKLQVMRKEIKEIKDTRLGALVIQGLDVDLKNAWTKLKHATPYCVCPLCNGSGKKGCGCKGSGWLNKEQYDRLPEDQRG